MARCETEYGREKRCYIYWLPLGSFLLLLLNGHIIYICIYTHKNLNSIYLSLSCFRAWCAPISFSSQNSGGFRVQGLGLGLQLGLGLGLGVRVQGFRGLGLRLGFRVQEVRFRFRVQGFCPQPLPSLLVRFRFTVSGLGFSRIVTHSILSILSCHFYYLFVYARRSPQDSQTHGNRRTTKHARAHQKPSKNLRFSNVSYTRRRVMSTTLLAPSSPYFQYLGVTVNWKLLLRV